MAKEKKNFLGGEFLHRYVTLIIPRNEESEKRGTHQSPSTLTGGHIIELCRGTTCFKNEILEFW